MTEFTDAQADTAIETAQAEYATTSAVPAPHASKGLAPLEADFDLQTVQGKLLDAVYSPYNQLIEDINNFRNMGDIDSLAKNEIETADSASPIGTLRDKIKFMKEKVAEAEKLINEESRAAAAEKLDPDFDELKARTNIKENRAHVSATFKIAQQTFEILGHVETIKEFGKADELVALDEFGEALKLAENLPNIKGTKGAASTGDSKTSLIREWAKAEGKEVSERGRISADLIAEYDAAHNV